MAFLNAFSALGRFLVLAAFALAAVGIAGTGSARMVFITIALSIGVTGFVFTVIGSRLGKVSGLDKGLRTSGVPGSALVTSMRETGVVVNGSPVIEFGLEVDSSAHAPYTALIRQRTPRLLIGSFLPGATVSVVVDPADSEHLAIDWEEAPREAPQSEELETTPIPTGPVDSADLLRTGRRARAVVIAMEDAGDMSELGLVEIGQEGDDDRLFIIELEVSQAGLDPYDVRIAHRVPERLVGKVGPRTAVDVAVDRDDQHVVAIDWEEVRR